MAAEGVLGPPSDERGFPLSCATKPEFEPPRSRFRSQGPRRCSPSTSRACGVNELKDRKAAMVGILQDKDRIFTNLYGFHDWGLEGARARGRVERARPT